MKIGGMAVGFGMMLVASTVLALETSELTTPKDKASYAIGMDMGNSLKKNGVDVNPDALAKALHPEGVLHIREPAKPGHGMPVSEIRALMRAAGLREIRAGCTRSFRWKWICDGIFRKSW